jgi:Xaa-Pro aminopeptidase
MSRLARLRKQLEQPLLVTSSTNVRYLTGFHSSNAALLVEPERLRLYTDFRYAEAARAVEDAEVVNVGRNLLADVGEQLTGEIAFEADAVSYAGYQQLAVGGAELVPTRGAVERLRAVKERNELDAIRAAASISDRVFEELAREAFVGRTERELAWWVERRFRELGAEALSFPAIVGAGETGAMPHAHPGERPIRPNETVVVDAGCIVDGYCSDCTRTFATGPLEAELAEAYEVCLAAQEQALEATLAGAACRAVDAVARDAVDASRFKGLFGHGLGHGVGLEVHEAPSLRPEAPADTLLEPGNVVTIEPGIYLPGRGGIRIEDLVVVTDGEPERLTRYTKQLVEVG